MKFSAVLLLVAAMGWAQRAPDPTGFGVPQCAHANAVAIPYPVFYGGGYYDYEAPAAPYSQDVSQISAYGNGYDQTTQPPVVIINQYFKPDTANPVVRDYSNVPLPEPGPQTANAGDSTVNTR